MSSNEMKSYSLDEMKDKYIGKIGTPKRAAYEHELQMDILGRMIRSVRKKHNLTQEELGKLVGIQKSQISKLENSTNSATIDTIIKVFRALKADINFTVKLEDEYIELT